MNKIIFLFLVSSLLILTSCEELTGSYTGANDIDESLTRIIGGVDAIVVGSEKFILDGTSDNSGNSAHNFHLRFKLPKGEKLEFHFFTSRSLNGGANFLFSRTAGKVLLKISLNNKSHEYELTSFNNLEIIDIEIDVHNDHTDTHMLAWDYAGHHNDNDDCTFDGGCLYNSADFAFDIWLGVGKANGTHWGFTGDRELILLLEGPLAKLSDA